MLVGFNFANLFWKNHLWSFF